MKIVADKDIPFLKGIFEPYADVVYIDGSQICHENVVDADVLIIRTRTRCDASLLEGTSVRFISSSAVGTDLIDFEYCNSHGITVSSAEGCNSDGVMQYVFSALFGLAARHAVKLRGMTMGIIGVGNAGSKVERAARHLGLNVLLNDPPRAEKEGPEGFCDLDYLLANSQIVTLHPSLNDSSRNMADAAFFAKMQQGAFFINTSRGEVVDEEALKAARPKLTGIVLDTWRNEPSVDQELLDLVDIATPHIAGYTLKGKQKVTGKAIRSVAAFLGIEELKTYWVANLCDAEHAPVRLDFSDKTQGQTASLMQYNYPVFSDDFLFRSAPQDFERIRNTYQYRREILIG